MDSKPYPWSHFHYAGFATLILNDRLEVHEWTFAEHAFGIFRNQEVTVSIESTDLRSLKLKAGAIFYIEAGSRLRIEGGLSSACKLQIIKFEYLNAQGESSPLPYLMREQVAIPMIFQWLYQFERSVWPEKANIVFQLQSYLYAILAAFSQDSEPDEREGTLPQYFISITYTFCCLFC